MEKYLYARMVTDRNVTTADYNVEPTARSGVTVTTLCGVRCRFDKRLPHGKSLFLYDTGAEPVTPAPDNEPYPGEERSVA